MKERMKTLHYNVASVQWMLSCVVLISLNDSSDTPTSWGCWLLVALNRVSTENAIEGRIASLKKCPFPRAAGDWTMQDTKAWVHVSMWSNSE
jgi:hypothetical protein